MNVLSCFDGISAGQLALQKSNIKVDKYYASEIDKYAIKVTTNRFPNTIQLGDIINWKNWKLPKIDLLLGGSPCQGFSSSGKSLNFEDPRSKLFFTFIDILKYYTPKYFLLENVNMKKEWKDTITDYIGVSPIEINSNLVSGQDRSRLYWTNIPNIIQPDDKNVSLQEVLLSGSAMRNKSYVIDANYYKGGTRKNHDTKPFHTLRESERRCCVKTEDSYRKLYPIEIERLQTFSDNYTDGISNRQRYRCLGNSWTIDIISHIFSFIKDVS